jgi:alpha-1,2-mannosyltransferase
MIGGDNQSLSAALMRLSRDISPPTILVLAMSASVMALGLVAAKRQIETGNDVNGLVCIAFASLLASPISWTHHWVWTVPALLVLVAGRHRVAAAALGVVLVTGPMWWAPRGNFVELKDNLWQAAACVAYVVVGLTYLIFFAVSRASSRTGSADGGSISRTGDARVTPKD